MVQKVISQHQEEQTVQAWPQNTGLPPLQALVHSYHLAAPQAGDAVLSPRLQQRRRRCANARRGWSACSQQVSLCRQEGPELTQAASQSRRQRLAPPLQRQQPQPPPGGTPTFCAACWPPRPKGQDAARRKPPVSAEARAEKQGRTQVWVRWARPPSPAQRHWAPWAEARPQVRWAPQRRRSCSRSTPRLAEATPQGQTAC